MARPYGRFVVGRRGMETGREPLLFGSVRMGLFPAQNAGAAGRDGGTANDLHPPLKSVFALRSEVVDVGFEMQFEDIVLVDVFRLSGDGDRVAQQGETGQRIIILVGLVEEQAEVGEDHPEFLPAVAVLELPQQVS